MGFLVFCVQRLAVLLARERPNLTDISLNIWFRHSLLKNPSLILTSAKPVLGQKDQWGKHELVPDPLSEPERFMQCPRVSYRNILISNTDPSPTDLSFKIERRINNET